jgi:phosphatidylglycerol:prolipoprotein diacylglycerol transferase
MKFPEGLPPTTVAHLSTLGVRFPPGSDPTEVVAVHPTQLYETAAMLVVFAWLWSRRRHTHGRGWLFGAYLLLAGIERFLVELVRAKDDRLLGPFTVAQATSVAIALVGAAMLSKWWKPGAAAEAPDALLKKPTSATA